MFFVFGREEKCVKYIQAESINPRNSFFLLVWGVPGAFYSPATLYEATALQGPPPSNGTGWG